MAKIELARYWERFFSWIIDFILVMIISGFILGDWRLLELIKPSKYIIVSLIFFIYWTIFEGFDGMSLGKRIMRIKVVGKREEKINIKQSAIESFGKAFILPIDIIIGLIARPEERTRAFSILAETKVVRIIEKNPKRV
ncbi:MAG: RDD family protein [Candidatus Aenigmarchaeota archaeon]|nr:RDD family protein [Candidatus Aenigmarchaeota archaeon]